MDYVPDGLENLLLDLISPVRPVAVSQIVSLSETAWDRLLTLAREQRVAPLLYWQLTHERADLPVPETVLTRLQKLFSRATLRSLTAQRELLLIKRVLDDHQIPYVALKGAFLAFHVYPHPALRPLRDIDILVPEQRALMSYQVMLDKGWRPADDVCGTMASSMELHHHLPPIKSDATEIRVEIHTKLLHKREHESDLSESAGFWDRCMTRPDVSGVTRYLSSVELLLHLIIHGVYDHGLNNGPLLFSDIAYLLKGEEIDWELFWSTAQENNCLRGCQLALTLTEYYWGSLGIVWGYGVRRFAFDEIPAIAVTSLMFQKNSDRHDVALGRLLHRKRSLFGKLFLVLGKFFPSRKILSSQYPVSADGWRIYLWYPVRWWQLLSKRLPEYLCSLRSLQAQSSVRGIKELERWLRQ